MGRRRISLALFAGVAALPLLTMGITVPAAVAKSRAFSEREAMRERMSEREAIHRSLSDYRTDASIAELEELHLSLIGMIPHAIDPLDEFGTLRAAAKALDVELVEVKAVRTHSLSAIAGSVTGGSATTPATAPQGLIQVDEVLVNLHEPIDKVFGLVQELRRRGLPTIMLSFDLSRETPYQRAFEAEVRFGFIRRAAPPMPGSPSAQSQPGGASPR
ncbi:MAG: hypothetical protein ACJA2W_002242 [Planctomycetota bacterium]|jgi:hypothetical protein